MDIYKYDAINVAAAALPALLEVYGNNIKLVAKRIGVSEDVILNILKTSDISGFYSTIMDMRCASQVWLLGFLSVRGSIDTSDRVRLDVDDYTLAKFVADILGTGIKGSSTSTIEKTRYYIYTTIKDISKFYGGNAKHEKFISIEKIPPQYVSFYVQGLFDACGIFKISKTKNGSKFIETGISTGYDNAMAFASIIYMNTNILLRIERDKQVYRFHTNNTADSITLIKWIYKFPWFIPSSKRVDEMKNKFLELEAFKRKTQISDLDRDNQLKSILGIGLFKPFYYDTDKVKE